VWANGPDGSGNGGWSAALLAEHVDAGRARDGVAVSLRVPPPIGRALQVGAEGEQVQLLDGDVLVASAEPAQVELDAPARVRSIDVAAARAASAGFPFRERHPFPRCVSCGTQRDAGQVALHLHCGPLDGVLVGDARVFADTWIPDELVADVEQPSVASNAACWSALDCPSAAPIADPDAANPIVLARIAARVATRPRIGDEHVLAAWHVTSDGRKHVTRSVLLDDAGSVLASADALWIEVRPR
jgi:hypothetical protein